MDGEPEVAQLAVPLPGGGSGMTEGSAEKQGAAGKSLTGGPLGLCCSLIEDRPGDGTMLASGTSSFRLRVMLKSGGRGQNPLCARLLSSGQTRVLHTQKLMPQHVFITACVLSAMLQASA